MPGGEIWKLKGEIGAQWRMKRWQREQSEHRHVGLRPDVGLFIYNMQR